MVREYKKTIPKDFAKRISNTCYKENSIVFHAINPFHQLNCTSIFYVGSPN